MRASANRHQKNRMRKSIKYTYIVIAITLIATSFGSLIKNLSKDNSITKTKQIYSYTNQFSYDYDVKLLKNKYINKVLKPSEKNNVAYVTDLIDTTNYHLQYTYTGSKATDLAYDYEVVGKMQAVYTKDGEEQKIMDQEETLIAKQTKQENTDSIHIDETLKLNLKDKNKLLNDFEQKMGMSITATYSIILKVNIKTNVEGKEVEDIYSPTITVDLAEKTTKILGEKNQEDTQYVAKEYTQAGKSAVSVIFNLAILVAGIYLLRYTSKAEVTNRIRNEYKQELNRILRLCQDKIVKVSTRPEVTGNIVVVRDFGEIVKLSEELFKPILYYMDTETEEAWFSVMSNNVTYRYILKK